MPRYLQHGQQLLHNNRVLQRRGSREPAQEAGEAARRGSHPHFQRHRQWVSSYRRVRIPAPRPQACQHTHQGQNCQNRRLRFRKTSNEQPQIISKRWKSALHESRVPERQYLYSKKRYLVTRSHPLLDVAWPCSLVVLLLEGADRKNYQASLHNQPKSV